MSERLIDLFRRSGDAHVGETLVRLAKLAAAAHQHQAVFGPRHARPDRDNDSARTDAGDGREARRQPARPDASAGTEARR